MPSKLITISGKFPEIPRDTLPRVSAYLLSGNQLLAQARAQSGGVVQFMSRLTFSSFPRGSRWWSALLS